MNENIFREKTKGEEMFSMLIGQRNSMVWDARTPSDSYNAKVLTLNHDISFTYKNDRYHWPSDKVFQE